MASERLWSLSFNNWDGHVQKLHPLSRDWPAPENCLSKREGVSCFENKNDLRKNNFGVGEFLRPSCSCKKILPVEKKWEKLFKSMVCQNPLMLLLWVDAAS